MTRASLDPNPPLLLVRMRVAPVVVTHGRSITTVLANPEHEIAPGGTTGPPPVPGTDTVVPAEPHAVPLHAVTTYEYETEAWDEFAGSESEVVEPAPASATEFRVHDQVVLAVVPAQVAERLTEPPALVSGLGLVAAEAMQLLGAPGAVGPVVQLSE
jgi:hypothetical protein